MSEVPPPLALTYHGVADVRLGADPDGMFVRPDDLRAQIGTLQGWGYELVTFGELARRARDGTADGHAALTFDDGFDDNLHTLVPILDEFGATATVFVVSGWLGRSLPHAPASRVLTADEVRELHGHGVEIGGHTASHPDLTTLTFEQAVRELRQARETLEEILGAPVTSTAYPWGRAKAETLRAAEQAGYRAAGRVHGEGSWDEPFNLPRQDMNNWSSLRGLRLKRDDRYAPLMRHALPRIVRRAAIVGKGMVRR